MTESSVVLPQPDGPTMQRHLALVDVPVDAPERMDPLLARAERLVTPRMRTATSIGLRSHRLDPPGRSSLAA